MIFPWVVYNKVKHYKVLKILKMKNWDINLKVAQISDLLL